MKGLLETAAIIVIEGEIRRLEEKILRIETMVRHTKGVQPNYELDEHTYNKLNKMIVQVYELEKLV